MTRFRRLLLWGAVLAPVGLLPTTYAVARVWLNRHLQRELSVGDLHLRMVNPVLRWDLDFTADSIALSSPRISVATGPFSAEIRIWNSIASLKPDLRVGTDSVRVVLASSGTGAERARRDRRPAPEFPNLRIPFHFRAAARRLEVWKGAHPVAAVREPALYSQGPKGAAVDWAGLEGYRAGDSASGRAAARVDWNAGGRASARWFGKTLRYVVRAEDGEGGYLAWEGSRRKSDLREGRDSLHAGLRDLGVLAPLFRRAPPDFRDISVRVALGGGKTRSLNATAEFETPKVWLIAPQRVEWKVAMKDSAGRMTFHTRGGGGESGYLQGRFRMPLPDSGGVGPMLAGLHGDLGGFFRGFRFRIGRRVLPGDVEIRKLKVLPGPVFEAQVRTKDNTTAQGRIFRRPDSSWAAVFEGVPSPREPWALIWTDTNVSYRSARVSGSAGREGLRAEAWVYQARAYGAYADSVRAVQRVNRHGYYLDDARVYGRDALWPVSGEVEWGKSRGAGARRRVSLGFRTHHRRFGSAVFSMPRRGLLRVKAERLSGQKLPYTRLRRLASLSPIVTGDFEWDIHARTGAASLAADFSYAGQSLGAVAAGRWDPGLLILEHAALKLAGTTIRASGAARLGGRQFWQARRLRIGDVRDLEVEARNFDIARLRPYIGPVWPVSRGLVDGRLAYSDTGGFSGKYRVDHLELVPLRKRAEIPSLVLEGRGRGLILEARTSSAAYPWLNDTVKAAVDRLAGGNAAVRVDAASRGGLRASFRGRIADLRSLQGIIAAEGRAELPGGAGEVRDIRLGGRVAVPIARDALARLFVDSGSFAGRYAVPGLDTQSFSGTVTAGGGRLRVSDLKAYNRQGLSIEGEAEGALAGSPEITARLRGERVAVRWPGFQELAVRNADAFLRLDASGLDARATVAGIDFVSARPPVSFRGSLQDVSVEYLRPPALPAGSKEAAPAPELKVKARLRDFLFKHKIGFREMQKSIGKVKVDKRKKRAKPVDLQLNLETAGAGNRIETDVLRMTFAGDLSVRGIYPYTLLSGEVSALKGELGQTSQSYDISDFDLKWQNATLEEGRINVEAGKKLRVNCKPETERTCNVFVKVSGPLDEMAFTYDTDCGANTGENLEPSALINSVSRGCWSEADVAGSGNGNYREAVAALLEPALNEKLSSVGERFTGGWIKRTSVTGIGSAVARDTSANEPLAIGVETKEKWGLSLKASAGYHPERREENTWESKVAAEWRLPLEKASGSSEWKRRVRDRVTLEASAESRPEDKVVGEEREARMQVGLRYRYRFWNLW